MEIDRYYTIYSTMTLATSTLIGLVGIFIIFRIQLQRDRIRQAYMDMHKLLDMEPERGSWDELHHGIRRTLEVEEENGDRKIIEHKYARLKKSEEILKYTISRGVFILAYVGLLFVLYVFILHFHNDLSFMQTHRVQVEITAFILNVIAMIMLLKYLITCILPKGDEYLY